MALEEVRGWESLLSNRDLNRDLNRIDGTAGKGHRCLKERAFTAKGALDATPPSTRAHAVDRGRRETHA